MSKSFVYKFIVLVFLFSLSTQVVAQLKQTVRKTNRSGIKRNKTSFAHKLRRTTWIFGLSGVVIDEDGRHFNNLFDVSNSWNYVPYPTRLTVEGIVGHGLSFESSFAYSRLLQGKYVDETNERRTATLSLFAVDFDAKYYLSELLPKSRILMPYAIAGVGYTFRGYGEKQHGIMGNVGFGLNIWIARNFGFNLQSIAKFGLNKPLGNNYLMHSVGIVYRFNWIRKYQWTARRYNLFRTRKIF
jgi:hypothetical protein